MGKRRPMPNANRREGFESFRRRSAVVGDDVRPPPNKSRGISEPTAYLETVDEQRTSSSSAPERQKSAIAMMWLRQAMSSPVVTNDLRDTVRSTSGGNSIIADGNEVDFEKDAQCSIGCLTFQLKADDEDEQGELMETTIHERNAGQYTVIAFVNSASGGGMGHALYKSLQSHLGPEYVIDLNSCRPGNMPEDALLKYAYDPKVRVLACGGDGTCGWIFSSLDKVWSTVLGISSKGRVYSPQYKDHLPLAIMPLGTGNDLSRQFGWGGAFESHMKEKSMITSVQTSKLTSLDRWRCTMMPVKTMDESEKKFVPKILGEDSHDYDNDDEETVDDYSRRDTCQLLESLLEDDDEPNNTKNSKKKSQKKIMNNMSKPSAQLFDGVFCNYFSLGFDATIAYLFHNERELHPEKFTSPTKNKMIYVTKSPSAFKTPKLRKNIKVLVNDEKGQLVNLKIPKSCRAIVSIFCIYFYCLTNGFQPWHS